MQRKLRSLAAAARYRDPRASKHCPLTLQRAPLGLMRLTDKDPSIDRAVEDYCWGV